MTDAPSGVARAGTGAREGLNTFAALILAGLMLVTVVDVVGRYVFNRPLPGSSEITELLMAVLIYAGLPVVSQRNAHITVDLLDSVTPASIARVRNLVVGLISVFVLAVIAWRLWVYAAQIRDSKDVTEYLKLPLAPFCNFLSIFAGIAAAVEAFRIARPAAATVATTT